MRALAPGAAWPVLPALLGVSVLAVAPAAQAGVSAFARGLCQASAPPSAATQDRRLRLVARLRQELEASGQSVALIARSGVDLQRFGLRDSHAGVSLRDNPNTPWSVRQLYYACEEGRPRLFDQGLAGFMLAADDQSGAHVTLLLLPPREAAALEAAALDGRQALQLLAARYSANAHAYSTRYQNCNQWVAELLAAAWQGLQTSATPGGPGAPAVPAVPAVPELPGATPPADGALAVSGLPTRAQAQDWLRARGYAPQRFSGPLWMFLLSPWVPLLHLDDHPEADLAAAVYQVSMPASIEAFVQRQVPAAQRIEFCQDERRIVVRRGWQPLNAACDAAPGDEVLPLQEPPAAPNTAPNAAPPAAPQPPPAPAAAQASAAPESP